MPAMIGNIILQQNTAISDESHITRAPRYRIHGTQYKTVQSWLVFKHVSTVQCSGSSFIQIQYKTKQFLYPKFSSVQYSTASRIRYIVSTVQNSIDICFVLHWYYKIQSSKSFIGVTSISNSQNCIGQFLLLALPRSSVLSKNSHTGDFCDDNSMPSV